MSKQIITISLVVLAMWLMTGCQQPKGPETVIDLADQEGQPVPEPLSQAASLLDAGDSRAAVKICRKWEKKNKDSVWLDHAYYYQAKGYVGQKKYYKAFKNYEKLLDQFVSSKFYEPALYQEVELAEHFLNGWKRRVLGFLFLPTRLEGIKILEHVEQRWPGSDLAARALLMQAEHYYKRRQYIESEQTCHIIIENYPRSAQYERAMYLVAEASFAQFEGVRYDTGCLDEALIRYEQFKQEFPQKAIELDVDNRISAIRSYQALKDFEIVDFYLRTHEVSAARHQLESLIERWSGTEWQRRAQGMLAELPAE